MGAFSLRIGVQVEADTIVADLSTRQYLQPHRPIAQVLSEASEALGFCPGAAQRAVEWLAIDAFTPIGRLKRTELMQLSRSIHRFWQQSLAQPTAAQPR